MSFKVLNRTNEAIFIIVRNCGPQALGQQTDLPISTITHFQPFIFLLLSQQLFARRTGLISMDIATGNYLPVVRGPTA